MDGGEGKPREAGTRPAYLGWFLLCLAFYVVGVATFGYVSHHRKKATLLKEVDESLLLAARGLPYMLAPDFHDRALGPESIGREEELRNRAAITNYAHEAGFKWAYTLTESAGRYVFTAPSVSEAEAQERESWYFYPYDDVPQAFVQAFQGTEPVFVDYTDQWSHFRSVSLPRRSPGGRPYLACADLDVTSIRTILRRNAVETGLTIL